MPNDPRSGSKAQPIEKPLALQVTEPGSLPPAQTLETAQTPTAQPPAERYELLELLGRGGMGEVHKARDRRLHRFVAVKFLRAEYEGAKLRFLQEARAQARIDHENVCKVHDVGELHGKPFLAMELVQGLPLQAVMAELRLEEKLCLVRDVAEALHAAHRLGILHRDVKPSNILVQQREDGTWRPVLMDFGLAHDLLAEEHLTQSGAVMGTPAYMSPEQARGDTHNLDRRTDVYALGATLFELLTGRPPFVSGNQTELLLKVLSEEPPSVRALRPGVPADLDTIVQKCLHQDPSQRYQSARALAEDLERYLNGEPILGRRASLLYRLRRRVQKHRAVVTVVCLALLGLAALGAYGIQARLQVRREQAATAARAKLSQELGQTIKEMEWFIRSVHQLPLHNIAYAKTILQARIHKLETLRPGIGNAGDGLVQYALGYAYVALQDFDRAYQHMSEAQRKGNNTPELRGTLGRVLGEQYKRKLEEALRTGDVNFVKVRKQELRTKYIQPAISLLRSSQGANLESPPLLEGQIALYSEQYDEALKKAEEVVKLAPWLYEAKQLAGDVHFARGLDLRNQTDYDAANQSFERAVGKYKEAAEIAHSDPLLYEAIAESYLQWADIATNLQMRLSETALLEQANAYCQKAMQISPDRPHCYSKSSRTYAMLSNANTKLERPVDVYLDSLLKVAGRGLLLAPDDAYIYDSLGNVYQNAADYAFEHSKDPTEYYELSVKNFQLALSKEPNFPVSLTNLGLTYLHGSYYVFNRTHTIPQAQLDSGIRYLRRACAVDPLYMPAWVDLSLGYRFMVRFLSITGRDPSIPVLELQKVTQESLAAGVKADEIIIEQLLGQDDYLDYLIWKGDTATLAVAWGQTRDLAAQIENRLTPDAQLLSAVRVLRAVAEGQVLLSQGQDPSATLTAGRSAATACSKEKLLGAMCQQWTSSLSLLAADFARLRGQPALLHLQQAAASARRAVELWGPAEQHIQLCRVLLRLADAQLPQAVPALVAEGLKSIAAALKEERGNGELYALRGQFYLLQGKTVTTAKERRDLAQQALDELTKAVKLNPLLARAYAGAITEADSQLSPPTDKKLR